MSQIVNQDQITKIEHKDYKSKVEKAYTVNKMQNKINDETINMQNEHIISGKTKIISNRTMLVLNESNLTPDAFPVNNSQTYIGLFSAALTVIVFFSSCTIFFMKQRGRNKIALLQKHTALLCSSPTSNIAINTKDIKSTPLVVNNLSQSRLSLKSKMASNKDYKSSDIDTNKGYKSLEKIDKMISEQYPKHEDRSNYKALHFGTYKAIHI